MSEGRGSPTKTPPGSVKVVRFHDDHVSDADRSVGTADSIWARETAAHRALHTYPQRQQPGHDARPRSWAIPSETQPLIPRDEPPARSDLQSDLAGSPFLRMHWDGAFYDRLEQENRARSNEHLSRMWNDTSNEALPDRDPASSIADPADRERDLFTVPPLDLPSPCDMQSPSPSHHRTASSPGVIRRIDSKMSIGSNADDAVYIDMLDALHEVPKPNANAPTRMDSMIPLSPSSPSRTNNALDETSTFESLVDRCRTRMEDRNDSNHPTSSPRQTGEPSGPSLNGSTKKKSKHKHGFSLDFHDLINKSNGSRSLVDAWRTETPLVEPLQDYPSDTRPSNSEQASTVPRKARFQAEQPDRAIPNSHATTKFTPPGFVDGIRPSRLLPIRSHHNREASMLEDISHNVRRAMRPLDPTVASKKTEQEQLMNAFEWDWKRPADEDLIIPPQSWLYLALIGFISFGFFYFVQTSSQFLDISVFRLSGRFERFGPHGEFLVVLICRSIFIAISYLVIRILSPRFAGGSGIPEMKCVFSGVYLPQALSVTTLVAKVTGMIFCFSSGLSVGRLGPYVHVSCICAALVSRIKGFSRLHGSARHQMQALSAATAAGVSATLGAPIGGTLLSIELMSTYYYVHWLPMALYCAISGYLLAVTFMSVDEVPVLKTVGAAHMHDLIFGRVILFAILGAICGKVGGYLIKFSTTMFKYRYRHFRSTARGLFLVVMVTILHNVIAYSAGGILWKSQKLGTVALLDSRPSLETSWVRVPVDLGHLTEAFSLLFFSALKFVLTGVSIVMPVPAGVFTCVFELGAGVGRLYGETIKLITSNHVIEPSVYAMVGAAAVTIGFVQAISVAVVMVELTGSQDINLLPMAVGCLTAYMISKGGNVDFFSAMIKLRRLPFILGLRETNSEERKWWRQNACGIPVSEFMNTHFPSVSPSTTNQEALRMVSQGRWTSCAFVSEIDGKLLGTVQRRALSKACGNAIRLASSSENYSTASIQRAASERVSFLQDFDPAMGHPAIDPAPFQVSEATPFWKVATYFQMLGLSTVHVTQQGTLVGLLSKAQFIEFNNSLNRRQELRNAASRGEAEITSLRDWNVPTVL